MAIKDNKIPCQMEYFRDLSENCKEIALLK